MISVNSFLRQPDGSFTAIEDATTTPSDLDYVEGAIELIINDNIIIEKRMWDYVDQLWSYITNMLIALQNQDQTTTFFPDQPIKLSFQRSGEKVLVSCTSSLGNKEVPINEGELVAKLKEAGSVFFHKMALLIPKESDLYLREVKRLADL